MKGQFYILAAFIVGMYVFFLLRMFTSTRTAFEVPDIPQVGYLHDAIQDAINQEGGISSVKEAINYIPDPIGIRCTALSTGEGTCDLYSDDWACGANVTVVYRGKIDLESTKTLYIENFDFNLSRTPVYIYPNDSANLAEVSIDVGLSSGTLKDTEGTTIKGKWSGTTVTFRTNLIKNRPKTVYIYHFNSGNFDSFSDVATLNDVGYSSSVLFSKINGKRNVENVTLSDLGLMTDGAGPRMLFIPGAYPDSYGTNLLNYINQGGIVVAPYGLCKTTGSCLIGNLESVSGGSLEATGDFSSLNPVTTGSQYFTKANIPWINYYSGSMNTSRSAIGATAYGEGYVVFLGNESMLTQWNQLDSFLDLLLDWGVNPITLTKTTCPVQSP